MRQLFSTLIAIAALASIGCSAPEQVKSDLRAPSYPLITIDPYTSAWSPADNLYDRQIMHWTEKDFPFVGVLRVDGETYRFMGIEQDLMTPIAPMGREAAWQADYTLDKPAGNWTAKEYNSSKWKKSLAPFGKNYTDLKTTWNTPDIWLRRNVVLSDEDMNSERYILRYSHDDIFKLYINCEQIIATDSTWKENITVEIPKEKIEKWGNELTIAAHCRNTLGGALVDFGLYRTSNAAKRLAQTAQQTSADVQATRTIYDFTCGEVDLRLTFMAPALLEDLNLVSRPVNYVTYEVASNDGAEHDVEIYFEAGPQWARHADSQKSVCETPTDERFAYAKVGTVEQPVLQKFGDDVRIDWGYFYLAGDKTKYTTAAGEPFAIRSEFIDEGTISSGEGNYLAISADLGKVGAKTVSDYIMVGYNDLYSILYYGEKVRPYWNRKGDSTIEQQFALAADEYQSLVKRCEKFDARLMAEANAAGGKEYAELCALAYRQSIAAHKLIESPAGELAWISKENFSNGCLGTVDVTFPSFPLYVYYNPDLAKGLLNFIFELCESEKWTRPYAAHDAGRYPHLRGEDYGGEGMPIEESGNMLIMTSAICQEDGSADYALKHWDVLTTWANYLVENGQDPRNQLCTDDFMGHLARNANLSIKAILGVASYADLAKMAGKTDIAEQYMAKAKEMAGIWKEMANGGDHYRLTFDTNQDTWSMKYNLVWDAILGFNVFDADIAETEVAYYQTKFNEYGLALDQRSYTTKSDWLMWSATLSSDKATFQKFITPMYNFYNQTTGRCPMPDLYQTNSLNHRTGWLQARSVVGGYWIKMLKDKKTK
ncbi:MAG: DUF4965 domain-containing protein [Alistipes sp.]|nr:DUF4965 domain-containing protein [Alistipes sp.]